MKRLSLRDSFFFLAPPRPQRQSPSRYIRPLA